LNQESIHEEVHTPHQPIHLGILLDDKIAEGKVTLRITPVRKQ
jgi:hypothetical protein